MTQEQFDRIASDIKALRQQIPQKGKKNVKSRLMLHEAEHFVNVAKDRLFDKS